MVRRLKKVFLIGFGVVVFYFAAAAGVLYWCVKEGPGKAVSYFRDRGIELTFDSVHSNYFNSLSVRGIEMKKPIRATVTKIDVFFRPTGLFYFGRNPPFLFDVLVVEPDGTFPVTQSRRIDGNNGLRPPARLTVLNGRLTVLNKKKALMFGDVKGIVRFGLTTWRGSFSAHSEEAGDVDGKITKNLTGGPSAVVRFDDLNLPKLADFLDKSRIKKYLSGKAEGEFRYGDNGAAVALLSKDVKVRLAPDARAVPVSGSVTLTPRHVAHDIWINGAVHVKGRVSDYRTNPVIKSQIHIDQHDLKSFLPIINVDPRQCPIDGSLRADVSIRGPLTDLSITGRHSLDLSTGQIKIPPLEGTIETSGKSLNIVSMFLDGTVALEGPIDPKLQTPFSVRLSGVRFNQLARMNGWTNVDGELAARLDLSLTNFEPKLDGTFSMRRLNWGRFAKRDIVIGRASYRNGRLQVDTNDESLVVDAAVDRQKMTLNDFSVRFSTSSFFKADGRVDYQNQVGRIRMSGQNIPPDTWPPIVARYPDITGNLDFEGSVNGPLSQPITQVKVLFNELRFNPSGGVWNGTMDLAGRKNDFILKNINIDGGYRGQIKWSNANKEIDVELNMENADPHLIAEVANSTVAVEGRLTGTVHVTQNPRHVVSFSTFVWTNGRLGGFRFDELGLETVTENEEIRVKNFQVIHDNRMARGSGRVAKPADTWLVDLDAQLQQWGNRRIALDGEIRMEGSYSMKTRAGKAVFHSPILLFNSMPIENISVRATGMRHEWSLEGNADPRLSFNLLVNSDRKMVRGRFLMDKVSLDSLTGKFLAPFDVNHIASGTASGKIFVRGSLSDPRAQVHIDVNNAAWRDETFNSTVILQVAGSTLSVISSKTRFSNGGTIFATGHLDWGAESPSLFLEGVGSSLKLNSLFNLMRWPARWDGETDMSFAVSGPKGKREIKISFDGHHEGIGPFSAGGKLTGTTILSNGEWDLTGIKVHSGTGYAELAKGSRVFIDRSGAGHMRLLTDTRNLHAGVLTFFGRVELTGSWGPREENNVDGERARKISVFARSLWINQFVLNGNVTNLILRTGKLEFRPIEKGNQQISGVLDYTDYPNIRVDDFYLIEDGDEKIYLDGFVGSPLWNFNLRVKEINSDVIRGLLDTTLPISGPMDIRITGRGNVKNPRISGNIAWKEGRIGLLPLDLLTGHIELEDGVLSLSKLFVRKKDGYFVKGALTLGTDLTEKGRSKKPAIDLKIEHGDLEILESVWPAVVKSRGRFEGQISFHFENDKPKLAGFLFADNMYLRSHSYIPVMRRGRVKIRFDEDKFEIQEARAKLDNGNLQIEGNVSFEDGVPAEYNVHAYTPSKHGITVRVPELAIPPGALFEKFSILKKRLASVSQGEAKFNLFLRGSGESPRFEGKIDLVDAVFTYPPQKSEESSKTFLSNALAEFFQKVHWDVIFSAGDRTRYENKLVDARINGSIHLLGPTNNLSVNGRIEANQGAIIYSGNEFKINEAVLEVITQNAKLETDHSKKIYVYLKANAEKQVYYTDGLGQSTQDTIIMEVDRALLGEIRPRFRSKDNPALSSQRALQLALGLPITQSIDSNDLLTTSQSQSKAADTDVMLRLGLVQLLDANLASPLARAVARQTGLVDFVRVTYDESTEDSVVTKESLAQSQGGPQNVNESSLLRYMRGTKVQLGRELSGRLSADYSFKVDEFKNELDLRHELELAYRLHRNLFLRATSELDTERTLGRPPDRRAILENRWRFGLPKKKKKKKVPATQRAPEGPNSATPPSP